MDGTTLIRDLAAPLALALLSVAMNAAGSGARQAVKAQPGEIVLLRDVSARPAYRMAPPGMALIADPKPQREIAAALGTRAGSGAMDELSDEDYAGMGAGHAAPASAPGGRRSSASRSRPLVARSAAAATAWPAAASAAP